MASRGVQDGCLVAVAGGPRLSPADSATLDEWTQAAAIADGRLFRCVNRSGAIGGDGITEKVVWHIVKYSAKRAGIQRLAPHDCRRTYARLCHAAGGELEQIQFLLGHVS